MIHVEVQSNSDGFINIQVDGHADKVICASVSTLLQSNVRFLQELAKQYPNDIKVSIQEVGEV